MKWIYGITNNPDKATRWQQKRSIVTAEWSTTEENLPTHIRPVFIIATNEKWRHHDNKPSQISVLRLIREKNPVRLKPLCLVSNNKIDFCFLFK